MLADTPSRYPLTPLDLNHIGTLPYLFFDHIDHPSFMVLTKKKHQIILANILSRRNMLLNKSPQFRCTHNCVSELSKVFHSRSHHCIDELGYEYDDGHERKNLCHDVSPCLGGQDLQLLIQI